MNDLSTIQKNCNELIIEARKLFEVLDESSKILKSVEDQLKESKAHFSFSYEVESTGAFKSFISWDAHEHSGNKFRLVVRENGNKARPLIETNIETRLKFIPYLNSFLTEFTIYLIQKRSEIQKGNIQ